MTQDERLQRAWLALAGWRVGMVDTGGLAFDADDDAEEWMRDAEKSKALLPALDSPANWGHWLEWVAEYTSARIDVAIYSLGSGRAWRVTYHGCPNASCESGRPARALLAAYVRACLLSGVADPWPDKPAVLDWWKHEQEGGS